MEKTESVISPGVNNVEEYEKRIVFIGVLLFV